MNAKTIKLNGEKYISINDLISYLDNTAMEFEKAKDQCGVETLNKLADTLSKHQE